MTNFYFWTPLVTLTKMAVAKVSSDELSKWQGGYPVEDLFYSQKEVARFLELGLLGLRKYPELSEEVRQTATEARKQHILAASLFKNFGLTASSVVDTYIPMITKAVNLKDIDIVIEAFGQVLKLCKEMKKETEDTRNSYLAIMSMLQSNVSKVDQKRSLTIKNPSEIEIENRQEEERANYSKSEQENLEKEEQDLQNRIKNLMKDNEEWLHLAVPPPGVKGQIYSFFEFILVPSGALIGGPIGVAIGAVGTGLRVQKRDRAEQALKASHEASEQIRQRKEELRNIQDAREKKKTESLERLARIQTRNLEKASLNDLAGLKEAVVQLGNVDRQLLRIVKFWDSMGTMLKQLCLDQKAGSVYLKTIGNEMHADKFRRSLASVKSHWDRIGQVCQYYVERNEKIVDEIYGFLSISVFDLTDEEVKNKQEQLAKAIEDEANRYAE